MEKYHGIFFGFNWRHKMHIPIDISCALTIGASRKICVLEIFFLFNWGYNIQKLGDIKQINDGQQILEKNDQQNITKILCNKKWINFGSVLTIKFSRGNSHFLW